jgi:hypothetical protein
MDSKLRGGITAFNTSLVLLAVLLLLLAVLLVADLVGVRDCNLVVVVGVVGGTASAGGEFSWTSLVVLGISANLSFVIVGDGFACLTGVSMSSPFVVMLYCCFCFEGDLTNVVFVGEFWVVLISESDGESWLIR